MKTQRYIWLYVSDKYITASYPSNGYCKAWPIYKDIEDIKKEIREDNGLKYKHITFEIVK